MKIPGLVISTAILSVFLNSCEKKSENQTGELKLWYQKPAAIWEEALPVGNGRLGGEPVGREQNQ